MLFYVCRSFSTDLGGRFNAFSTEEDDSVRNDSFATITKTNCLNSNIDFNVGRVKTNCSILIFTCVLGTNKDAIMAVQGGRLIFSGRYTCLPPLTVKVFYPSWNRTRMTFI